MTALGFLRRISSFWVACWILGVAAFGQPASDPPSKRLAEGKNVSPAWAEVVPFSPRGETTWLRWSPDAESLRLPAVETGAALVCLGGEGIAVDCRQIDLEQATAVSPWRAPGVVVQGRLQLRREPLAGAEVALVGAGYHLRRSFVLPLAVSGNEPVRWLGVGKDGTFELPQLAAGEYRLEVKRPGGKSELTEPFTVPRREALLPREAAGEDGAWADENASVALDLGVIILEPGLEIAVSVITATGEPLVDATVGAIQSDGAGGAAPSHYSVPTDSQGQAVIRGVEAGRRIEIACRVPGFARYQEKFASPPTDVVCILEPLAAIVGAVTAEGEPLAGATVSLSRPDGSRQSARRQSDAEGRFDFDHRLAGGYRLTVAAPGFQVEERRLRLEPGEALNVGDIELLPAVVLEGLVVEAGSGAPIAGATILALEPAGLVNTATDGEGRFEFSVDGPETLRLLVEAKDFPATLVKVQVAPEATEGEEAVRIELTSGGRIEALVWDEETGQPCLGCDLTFHRLDGPTEVESRSLTTNVEGRAVSQLLAPGPYRVVREKVTTHGSTVSVSSGDDARDVMIQPHEVGRVFFGSPRDILQVQLWPPPPAGWQVAATDSQGLRIYSPDASGRFDLHRMVGSATQLRLQGQTSQPMTVSLGTVPADFEEPQIDLELSRARVRGRLVGDPVEIQGSVRAVTLGGTGARAWTLSGPDGRFEMPFLPAGTYRLSLRDQELATFTLAPGETLDLEAEVPSEAR